MVYGSEAVHELIEASNLSYPVSVSRLERTKPLENIQIDEKGTMILLSELLADVEFTEFENRNDLEQKLEPVMTAESRSRHVGVIGKIKRTFLGR